MQKSMSLLVGLFLACLTTVQAQGLAPDLHLPPLKEVFSADFIKWSTLSPQQVNQQAQAWSTWQYHADLPLFCRMEATVETNSPVPLRFRLGSLDYVNLLEGKPFESIWINDQKLPALLDR
ncbi:MAG: hypothetical protein AAGH79_18650 [Bacteroidota bacterium]